MRKAIDLIAIIMFGVIVIYIASVVSSNVAAAQYAVSGFWGGWADSPKTSTIAFWIVLVYLGLVVLTCSLCWKSPLLVLAVLGAVSIMVLVNPSYSIYICYVMFGPGHFIGDLLMPITSFCGAVILGGQFAFENGYGWFVRLICVLLRASSLASCSPIRERRSQHRTEAQDLIAVTRSIIYCVMPRWIGSKKRWMTLNTGKFVTEITSSCVEI